MTEKDEDDWERVAEKGDVVLPRSAATTATGSGAAQVRSKLFVLETTESRHLDDAHRNLRRLEYELIDFNIFWNFFRILRRYSAVACRFQHTVRLCTQLERLHECTILRV
jgi:hypothetical protein